MGMTVNEAAMRCWLRSQVMVVEAWRAELARQPQIDLARVEAVERHYQWLTGELGAFREAP
jgi:hypothetical protein